MIQNKDDMLMMMVKEMVGESKDQYWIKDYYTPKCSTAVSCGRIW